MTPVPPPTRSEPHPVVYLLGVLGTLVLLLALIAPLAVGYALVRWAPFAPDRTRSSTAQPADTGAGVGDPYFPTYGSSGYDTQSTVVTIDWDTEDATLTGRATITAVATRTLDSVFVDLALPVTAVTVDGQPATATTQGTQDVEITGPTAIRAGDTFSLVIDYAGAPGSISRSGPQPVHRLVGEWVIAGQPESSAWWFPANDHPSDPATFDLSVRVPAGLEAISIGRLVSRDAADEPDHDTWHWVSDAPVATYLTFLGIGQYDLQEGIADGRPFVYAVSRELDADLRAATFAELQRTPSIIAALERRLGPYPFDEIGGFVPSMRLDFAGLETQTRPVYTSLAIADEGFATELLVHELAHQWLGDHVTLARWDDIFTNEAYASWVAWSYDEDQGGPAARDRLRSSYAEWVDHPSYWEITMIDPGAEHLFDTVYTRGPMTLEALRVVIGDDAFDRLTRAWAQEPGSRSLEQWMVRAQSVTRTDLTPFFDAWIYGTTPPAPTAANGLG